MRWRNASDELKLNGVVYNEMKGAFSSPDERSGSGDRAESVP